MLAYSTISHLGLITLLLGLERALALVAAIFHIMNHATFKASLFMAAGIIDHETGTRDIRRLSGLWRFMPITGDVGDGGRRGNGRRPLLNGFLSKEMFFAETIEIYDGSLIDQALPYIATLASMFSVAYSLRFIQQVFFGPPRWACRASPTSRRSACAFRVESWYLACLVVGIMPGRDGRAVARIAVRAVLGPSPPTYSLAVWHGFTAELLMSTVGACGGVLCLPALPQRLSRWTSAAAPASRGPTHFRARDRFCFPALAARLESIFGTRRLQPQLRLPVCTALLAGFLPLLFAGLFGRGIT